MEEDLNDLRKRVLAGTPLSASEMHQIVESLRKARTAKPAAKAEPKTKAKKTTAAPKKAIDDLLNDLNS